MWPSGLITETGTRAFDQLHLPLRHKAGTVWRQEENKGIKIKVYFTFDFPFVFSLIRFPYKAAIEKTEQQVLMMYSLWGDKGHLKLYVGQELVLER